MATSLSKPRDQRLNRYPPLAMLAAAVVLAALGLPSALILPQPSPTQTMEYAPVPGNSNSTQGNFSSLGLGTGEIGPGGLPPSQPQQLAGSGAQPSTKQCVGNPPRQTEDTLSPPCVAFFTGDNGGATYPGVTAREVRVLFYIEGGSAAPGAPAGSYVDLGAGPASDPASQQIQALQKYFNTRYQTYNRFVHFWVYFTVDPTQENPAQRRADAADNYQRVHPAAVLNWALKSTNVYTDEMASRGVIVFQGTSDGSPPGAPESYFQRYPNLLWSYFPSLEQRARQVAAVVCSEMAGRTATYAGNPLYNGKPRVFGIVREGDAVNFPEDVEYGALLKPDLQQQCGLQVKDDIAYSDGLEDPQACRQCPSQAMAQFEADGVTTVINSRWDLGVSYAAAQSAGYEPEWLVAGNNSNDITESADETSQSEISHAWLVTEYPRRGPQPGNDQCFVAVNEGNGGQGDAVGYGCLYYSGMRQLFIGIQLAGPHLTPADMAQGFHAIPGTETGDPRTPACFYPAGDNTCIKDAVAEWWDPTGTDPELQSAGGGCWRLPLGGERFLVNGWPQVEINSRRTANDVCNAQIGNY